MRKAIQPGLGDLRPLHVNPFLPRSRPITERFMKVSAHVFKWQCGLTRLSRSLFHWPKSLEPDWKCLAYE